MRNVSVGRRGLLFAVGSLAMGSLVGCAARKEVGPPPPPSALDESEQAVAGFDLPVVHSEVVYSKHRGTSVQLYTVVPSGVDRTEDLPMVLYLHGRDGVNPTPVPYDTLSALERGHRDGSVPPFGFVVAEGGYNPYWYDGSLNGDLLSMLMEDVPAWLVERGFRYQGGLPVACAGISTGGFGALRYAIERTRSGAPVSAVGVLAPALPVTWEHMQEKNAFLSEEAWRENDPLQNIDDLGDVPLGAWIGDIDVFLEGLTQLVEEHENTPVFSVLPGGHEPAVFDVVGTDMVRFLGTRGSTLG